MMRGIHVAMVVVCACGIGVAAPTQEIARVALSAARLNEALGMALWTEAALWTSRDEDVAGRLGLPRESKTSTQSSFRSYPDAQARVLGARPYSFALYGETGFVTSLSIVFANKGDVEGLSTGGDRDNTAAAKSDRKKALREYGDRIRKDAKTIETTLSTALGKPRSDIYGEGSGALREEVKRWDANGHAILLAAPKDEYVCVRIVPTAVADEEGKGQKIPDKTLREQLAKRIDRRTNGDVVVTDIPMVNQGPKGFCVPATWERYLRYLGIPADMYILAMAANTGVGGGTIVNDMAVCVDKLVKRHGRRIQRDKRRMQVRFVKDYIDKGLPVMWPMYVDKDLYKAISDRTEQRRACSDMKAWIEKLKAARQNARYVKPSPEFAHICMVIGYNRETGEIATTDSWGDGFAERWMTEEEADAISGGELWTVAW